MSLTSWVGTVRSWVGRPLGRALLVLGGLAVLSLVGRFAVAGGQVPPVTTGVLPLASLPLPPPPPMVDSVDATAPVPTPATHSRSATADDPVYINEATIDDLRRLPGVGEKRGLAILELRHKLGHFRQIEDLLRVKGIGRSTLRRLRPLVRLDHGDGGA